MEPSGNLTQILQSIQQGDLNGAHRLMELVYDDLQRVAQNKLAQEPAGITLDAVGLVHETYLRMFDRKDGVHWQNRKHFFGAAAEAMRRILIDNARKRRRFKRGGHCIRLDLSDIAEVEDGSDILVEIDDCLEKFHALDPDAYEITRLHLYAGLSIESAAEVVGMARATAYRHWNYARAWLQVELGI